MEQGYEKKGKLRKGCNKGEGERERMIEQKRLREKREGRLHKQGYIKGLLKLSWGEVSCAPVPPTHTHTHTHTYTAMRVTHPG